MPTDTIFQCSCSNAFFKPLTLLTSDGYPCAGRDDSRPLPVQCATCDAVWRFNHETGKWERISVGQNVFALRKLSADEIGQ